MFMRDDTVHVFTPFLINAGKHIKCNKDKLFILEYSYLFIQCHLGVL
jgi:hypothetical protein